MKNLSRLSAVAGLALVLSFAYPVADAHADNIRNIKVEGTQRIEPATVLSYIDVHSGDAFEPTSLDRALKNLYATGLFADVSLYKEASDLIVVVVENPIVNEISFEGNKEIKDENLLSEIQIRPRTVFTRTKVQTDVERLQELYRLSGRFSVDIQPKIIKLDQNRVNLVFEVTEGPTTRIARISFIGNKRFDDDALQKVIRTKEERWWRVFSSQDKYDPDRLAFDREMLRKFYLDHGYADFRVDNAIAELSPDHKNFLVTFTVEEGDRYKVGKVHIQSNIPEVDATPLKTALTFAPDDWYKASDVEKTVYKMTEELGNSQYAFIDIRPDVQRNREQRTIDVTFSINEGQKTFVENINVGGNMRTLDEVIRREMTLVEGDPFNTSKLKKSEQRIRDLGFFETVQVKPVPGSAPDKTNIDVAVEEKSTGDMSIGAGFSSSDGPLGEFRIREKNFLGKGQDLQFSTTLSGKRNEFDLSFTEPYFLKRDLSAGFDIFHVTRDYQDESSYDSKKTGGALRLGYPLSDKWRQSLSYRYENNDITNVKSTASTYIRLQEGKRSTSALSSRLTYDTTDSKLNPTEGLLARIDTEVAGLGGDAQYLKARLGGTYYYPVYESWVLSLLGEGGYVVGWGGEDVRINERFYIGGATLRGFADAGIGPRDSATRDALGGNQFWRGSAELDMPTGLPEDLGIRGHVFTDFGSLSDTDETGAGIFDEDSIRMSAGAGVTWKSPMGPVRVDLAAPIVKEDFDDKEVFRFSFGTRF